MYICIDIYIYIYTYIAVAEYTKALDSARELAVQKPTSRSRERQLRTSSKGHYVEYCWGPDTHDNYPRGSMV